MNDSFSPEFKVQFFYRIRVQLSSSRFTCVLNGGFLPRWSIPLLVFVTFENLGAPLKSSRFHWLIGLDSKLLGKF